MMKRIYQIMARKKLAAAFFLLMSGVCLSSCNDFLDIMPDNVATVDHAFTNEIEAEKYLFTCYSYLPGESDLTGNVGLLSGDEFWIPERRSVVIRTWETIAHGYQSSNNPVANYWDGWNGGKPLFQAIRDCNVFLENIEDRTKVRDLSLDKRNRWIAEVKFLKAYYHFYLLRMYGPIPIIDKNLPISATPNEVRIKRQPADDCTEYIVNLLDEAYNDLPLVISRPKDELGRITKPICRAIQAKVLLLAASPLFNGNSDYASFTDKEGNPMFNPVPDQTKWEKAAQAAQTAIEVAEQAGFELFYYKDAPYEMSETSLTQMSLRHAVCERWNKEIVWGLSGSVASDIQERCMALVSSNQSGYRCGAWMAPTLKIVKQFYTKHGVPIEEDKTLDFDAANELRTSSNEGEEKINFIQDYPTARINFDRENRFYACLGFDGGKWLMADNPSRTDYGTYEVKAKLGQLSYGITANNYSVTGYFTKKLVHFESIFEENSSGPKSYPWPAVRLADIYLMYAEALNEAEGPTENVHKYINLIRARAGLESVKDSWTKYSSNPSKPDTKDGMREIIHRERLNEFALEGQRFWDLRRWKKALETMNEPVKGWDITQKTAEGYYQERTIYQQEFVGPRDYLWPIRMDEISVNYELIQNPGW